ncbi:hypothetical protein P168DRAFT_306849 [Aspergillus campestris IBT 28561]|uniref:Uncharacterized protein n=1 Tax=Aspergillus campestris (strain IBT 28561) TaxID=1392248 RepID=A0A2I1CVT7_ASPC2|nr:uncharacterized protein P168DRAFT_306849 [Aspergillus campestris IBT 28561]PKY01739.1 hypothetical protein P168DRAFT_306849 [Aspergillus campestris IBT 28561]
MNQPRTGKGRYRVQDVTTGISILNKTPRDVLVADTLQGRPVDAVHQDLPPQPLPAGEQVDTQSPTSPLPTSLRLFPPKGVAADVREDIGNKGESTTGHLSLEDQLLQERADRRHVTQKMQEEEHLAIDKLVLSSNDWYIGEWNLQEKRRKRSKC